MRAIIPLVRKVFSVLIVIARSISTIVLDEDFMEGSAQAPGSLVRSRKRLRSEIHAHIQSDWITVSEVQKSRQRSCKICALLRSNYVLLCRLFNTRG